MGQLIIDQGDITTWKVDAIVNAANNDLILGGGVAGAIARRGGPTIQQECDKHGPIRVGEAAITTGGNLPARFVIHAASMRLGGRTTADSLKNSILACLNIAEEKKLISIAFPAIGTGIAGFPIRQCAEIMVTTFLNFLTQPTTLEKIFVVLYDQESYNIFADIYTKAVQKTQEK